jgi:hypothetical protein
VVWNAVTGDRIRSYSGLGGAVAVNAAFAPSGLDPGERLYLGAHDGTLLDVNLTGALLGSHVAAAADQDFAIWPPGHAPLSVGSNGMLHDVNLGGPPPTGSRPTAVDAAADMVAVGGTGAELVGSTSGQVALLDPAGRAIRAFRSRSRRAEDQVTGVATAPDARAVFAATAERQVLAYDGITGTLLRQRPVPARRPIGL